MNMWLMINDMMDRVIRNTPTSSKLYKVAVRFSENFLIKQEQGVLPLIFSSREKAQEIAAKIMLRFHDLTGNQFEPRHPRSDDVYMMATLHDGAYNESRFEVIIIEESIV